MLFLECFTKENPSCTIVAVVPDSPLSRTTPVVLPTEQADNVDVLLNKIFLKFNLLNTMSHTFYLCFLSEALSYVKIIVDYSGLRDSSNDRILWSKVSKASKLTIFPESYTCCTLRFSNLLNKFSPTTPFQKPYYYIVLLLIPTQEGKTCLAFFSPPKPILVFCVPKLTMK